MDFEEDLMTEPTIEVEDRDVAEASQMVSAMLDEMRHNAAGKFARMFSGPNQDGKFQVRQSDAQYVRIMASLARSMSPGADPLIDDIMLAFTDSNLPNN